MMKNDFNPLDTKKPYWIEIVFRGMANKTLIKKDGAFCKPVLPNKILLNSQETAYFADLISHLPRLQKQVLELHYAHEMSFARIGASLGFSPQKARYLWLKALKALREDERTLKLIHEKALFWGRF